MKATKRIIYSIAYSLIMSTIGIGLILYLLLGDFSLDPDI